MKDENVRWEFFVAIENKKHHKIIIRNFLNHNEIKGNDKKRTFLEYFEFFIFFSSVPISFL